MEDVVNNMRIDDITISSPRTGTRRNSDSASFSSATSANDPTVAHRVAERLTSLFVDENSRQRENIAEGTDQFISAEVEAARVRLEETEARLEDYKRKYGGQLPEQMQSNVAMLQTLQMQIQALNESINRDRAGAVGRRAAAGRPDGRAGRRW